METNEHCIVLPDGWVLYADGTLREHSATGYGMTKKPENEYERSRLVFKFWELKLELSIEEFDDQKAVLLGDTRNRLSQEGNPGGPCMDETEAVGLLNTLKAKVNHCKEMLAEAESQLETNTPSSLKKSMDITE